MPKPRRQAVLLALALAGCNSQPSVEAHNESVEKVAGKVAASGIKPLPGRWESATTIEQIDFPGITPQMREMMRRSMGQKQLFAKCLTPAEAAKPAAGFFQNKDSGCTYDNFTMADGRIDAKLTCKTEGEARTMTMNGTYTPASYDVKVTMKGVERGQPVSMAMATAAKNVGACTGKEDSAGADVIKPR